MKQILCDAIILLMFLSCCNAAVAVGEIKPFIWPLDSNLFDITQGFGKTPFSDKYSSGSHWGIDMSVCFGAPVRAAADGFIAATGDDACPNFSEPECNYRRGNWIIIWHPNHQIHTFYGHLKDKSNKPSGSFVRQGEIIGHEGHSGYHFDAVTGLQTNNGSHLHFSVGRFHIYRNFEGKTDFSIIELLNPMDFLPRLKK